MEINATNSHLSFSERMRKYEAIRDIEMGFNATKTGMAFAELHKENKANLVHTLGSLLTIQDTLVKVLTACGNILEADIHTEGVERAKVKKLLEDVYASIYEVSNDMKNDVMKDKVDEYFLSKRFAKDLMFIIDAVNVVKDDIFDLNIEGEGVGREIVYARGQMVGLEVAKRFMSSLENILKDTNHESRYSELLQKLG